MSVEKFLRQRAVNIICEGTYQLHRWYDPQGRLRTLACRTTRVSPFRMIVDVPVVGRIGARAALTAGLSCCKGPVRQGSVAPIAVSLALALAGIGLRWPEAAEAAALRLAPLALWLLVGYEFAAWWEERYFAQAGPSSAPQTLIITQGSGLNAIAGALARAGGRLASGQRARHRHPRPDLLRPAGRRRTAR